MPQRSLPLPTCAPPAPADATGVLTHVLESAALAGAPDAHLFIVEPGGNGDARNGPVQVTRPGLDGVTHGAVTESRLVMRAGVGAFAAQGASLRPGQGLAGRGWETGQAVVKEAVNVSPDQHPAFTGAGAVMRLPFRQANGETSGALGVARTRPTPFTAEEARLLAGVADLAGVAVEALGLAKAARKQLGEQQALDGALRAELREARLLTRVVAAATASLEPQQVLEGICHEVANGFGVRQAGFAVLNADGSALTVAAEWIEPGHGGSSSLGEVIPIAGNASTEEALRTLEVVAIADTASDPRATAVRALVLSRGIRAILIVPMILRGVAVGTLGIDFPKVQRFSVAELLLAKRCAAVAAQALENARLHAAARAELLERERIERELRAAEGRTSALLDAIPDLIFRVSRDGVYLDAKAPAGVDLGHLPGRRFEDVLPPTLAILMGERVREALMTREVRTVEYSLESQHGPREYEARVAAGEQDDAVILVRDVTERSLSERALLGSHRRFTNLVNNLDSIVWEANPVTLLNTFVSRQAETLLGYPVGQWCEEPEFWARHVHPDDRPKAEGALIGLMRRGQGRLLSEYRMLARDGREVWFRDAAGLFGQGAEARLLGVMVDITERKRAERLQEDTAGALEMVALGEPLDATLSVVARMVERHCPGMSVAIYVTRVGGLHLSGAPGLSAGMARVLKMNAPRDQRMRVVQLREAAFGGCALGARGQGPKTDATDGPGFADCWSFPMLNGDGPVLGVLSAFSERPGEPNSLERETLDRATRLAAMAVEHSNLTDRLAYEAGHDALTGLPNRTLFQDRLRQMLALAARQGGQSAVFFLDLDRFKHINDTLGHSAGDIVLRQVALRLEGMIRESDLLARLGGDEFTLAASNLDELGAARLAEKVLQAFAAPFTVGHAELYLTASLGITLSPRDGRDVDTMQRQADVAMYRAKGRGGNAFEFFRPEMNERAMERLELENDLRRGIERNEFVLHFQPEVRLSGELAGRPASIEALVRWRHPTRGLLPPSVFIPIAEETGLIVRLGGWILGEACRVAATWRGTALESARVAVNVSALQFTRSDLRGAVQEALSSAGLGAESLELELSESTVMGDGQGSALILTNLRELGVHVAVDDFGTGYSNLRYLQRLPLDTLKVEGSFVKDMLDGGSLPLVQAVIALGRSLGLQVVAEWVETREQADVLASLGCDLAQGFHFARPLPAKQLLEWARNNAENMVLDTTVRP